MRLVYDRDHQGNLQPRLEPRDPGPTPDAPQPHDAGPELDPAACYDLLAGEEIGRIAFDDGDTLTVVPVTYGLDPEGAVVFRAAPGHKLRYALREARPVAFEVDHYDPDARTGWSVLVRGRLDPVLDLVGSAGLDRRGPTPWHEGAREGLWLRLAPTAVTGRRLPAP